MTVVISRLGWGWRICVHAHRSTSKLTGMAADLPGLLIMLLWSRQTLPVDGHIVNILDSVGHVVTVRTAQL